MIYSILEGGLGNQLFQCCFAFAKGAENGEEIKFDLTGYYFFKERKPDILKFKISDYVETCKFPKWMRLWWFRYLVNIIKNKFVKTTQKINLDNYQNVQWITEENENIIERDLRVGVCYGYFQSERFFSSYREQLLSLLEPNYEYTDKVKLLMKRISSEETVSLHIRRGDYVSLGINMKLDYYYKALDYLADVVGRKLKIYIFSDDIGWAKENLKLSEYDKEFIHLENKTADIDEMMLMSKCKNNIIANSTFSWWGAWLNQNREKIVIAPKVAFNNVDIIPKEWIRI